MVKSVGVILTAALCAVLTGEGMIHAPQIRQAVFSQAEASPSQGDEAMSATASVDTPPANPPGAAYVAKARDGHYWAWAQMDGHPVRVLVDTGASTVALTPEDARRIGVSMDNLVYDHPVTTAAGVTQAAAVTLKQVSVASATVTSVKALIVPKGLSISLLGMSYLGRLDRFEATRGGMILHP
jgi:aspartyl protease family protein